MGTKVDCKSFLTGYNSNYQFHNSMRDLNEDSSSSSWPACYVDNNTTTNGPYYYGFGPRATVADGYGKDALKQKMLEHEAVFKNQVYELHRLYRIQMDMMDEFKRKPLYTMEPSSSSNLRSQIPSQDPRNWHNMGFPLIKPGYENSPMSCTKGYNMERPSKEYEPSDSRPLKVRKRLFDLQLPADEYIDTEESETKVCTGIGLADLNEPVEIEEATALSTVDFLDHNSINGVKRGEIRDWPLVKLSDNERGRLSHLHEAGSSKSNLTSVTHGLHKEKMAMPSYPPLNLGPDLGPVSGSSYFSSRPRSIASWANPMGSSFTQKLTTAESRLDPRGNMHALSQLGEKWFVNGGDMAAKNGFYHGSGKTNIRFWDNSKPVIEIDLNEAEDRPSGLAWLNHGPTRGKRPAITDLNEPSSDCEIIETTNKDAESAKKILGFDINLECEPQDEDLPSDELTVEKEVKKETEISCVRDYYIDLNSRIDDDFEEENETLTSAAAEIMIAISASCPDIENSCPSDDDVMLAESLLRFADDVLDDFEEMTLQIRETREEEYMPQPTNFVVPEEVGPATNVGSGARPRRGQARRGRQRRDFQRDILPGLVSLSRLEVSEDIQMFSGLMRATGQHWVSGLARRNGRRRNVGQSGPGSNERACRALLGWGKTTRRPRRQRCPTTGNSNHPAAVVLT